MKLTVDISEQPDGQVAVDINGTGVCSPREVPVLAKILNALTFVITSDPCLKMCEHESRDISIPLGKPSNG